MDVRLFIIYLYLSDLNTQYNTFCVDNSSLLCNGASLLSPRRFSSRHWNDPMPLKSDFIQSINICLIHSSLGSIPLLPIDNFGQLFNEPTIRGKERRRIACGDCPENTHRIESPLISYNMRIQLQRAKNSSMRQYLYQLSSPDS